MKRHPKLNCAQWLRYCLSIGYTKEELPALADIWFKYYDR